MKILTGLLIGFSVVTCSVVWAHGPGTGSDHSNPYQNPDTVQCQDHGKDLTVMNDTVRQWKTTTQNDFRARAWISGTVDEIFSDQTGHRHFSLKIGPGTDDHIEVIYNQSFGDMPEAKIGDTAQACGDYITSFAQSGGYQASPDGALIHWVHKSTDIAKHDSGFVILNNVVYGGGSGSGD
jgi:hypothetical protein